MTSKGSPSKDTSSGLGIVCEHTGVPKDCTVAKSVVSHVLDKLAAAASPGEQLALYTSNQQSLIIVKQTVTEI